MRKSRLTAIALAIVVALSACKPNGNSSSDAAAPTSSTVPSSAAVSSPATVPSPSASAPSAAQPTASSKVPVTVACADAKLKLNVVDNMTINDVAVVPNGSKGINIYLKVSQLGSGCTIWAFDHGVHSDDPLYYLDDNNQGVTRPVATANGDFVFHNRPVGSLNDENERYETIFVVATKTCAAKLYASSPNGDGDLTYTSLPAGCTRLGAQQLSVTRR